MSEITQFFHEHLNMWNTSIYLVVFTILFVLADEYIAKPYRHRQMENRAKTDPEVRAALETAERVHKLVKEGKLTG
ncbi:MAG: hypothetical protein ACREQ9_00305 [Candidatus Binatia bacterium]